MKGLQRKCLVASAFTHGLLLVLVVVGSAFISKKPSDEPPAFELFDMQAILVDQPNILSGGDPSVTKPPQPAPQSIPPVQQQAPPVVQEQKRPDPPAEQPKEDRTEPIKQPSESKPEPKTRPHDPESFDLSKAVTKAPTPKPEKPAAAFDFAKAEKKTIKPAKDGKETSDTEEKVPGEREKQVAQARAGALSDALKRVQGGLSSVGGSYEIPGPGGPAYASYYLALRKFYENAWIPPNAARGDEPVVEVEVVIAKDGTILSQRILKKSGRRELDNSVQNTLNRVFKARAPRFPEGSTDEKRTFRINFNLTEKLTVG